MAAIHEINDELTRMEARCRNLEGQLKQVEGQLRSASDRASRNFNDWAELKSAVSETVHPYLAFDTPEDDDNLVGKFWLLHLQAEAGSTRDALARSLVRFVRTREERAREIAIRETEERLRQKPKDAETSAETETTESTNN